MKKLLCLALALVMVLTFGACSKGDGKKADTADSNGEVAVINDLDYIKENGKLVIGITDYAPMNFKDESGAWTGFDTEFAQAVCAKLGVDAEFVEIEWDSKFIALKAKDIDCIWNGMTISEDVLNNTDCSVPYVKNAQIVVMNKDKAAEYASVEDMKELTFAVEASSAGATAAEENGLENVVEVTAQTDALLEVASGSSDACIIDITMANSMTGEGTSYDSLTTVCELTSEEYGIGFRQGSDLTAEVNAIIAELIADGTLAALADKYELTLVQ